MAYSVPVAKVTINDPRHLGAVLKMGWAGDFPFATAETAAAGRPPLWQYLGCREIPEQRAIISDMYPLWADMTLADWQVQAGDWDDRARPSTNPRVRFLHAYSGAVGSTSRVVSTKKFGPNWCAKIYRHVPPAGTGADAACDFSIKMAADSGPTWRIVIPTQNRSNKYPRLMRSASYGLPAYEWSRLDLDTCSGEQTSWQEYVIWCEQYLCCWEIVVAVNGTATRWFYRPPGGDIADATASLCGTGPIEIQSHGQQLMVALAPLEAQRWSQAYLRVPLAVDTGLADLTDADQAPQRQYVAVTPTGTDAIMDIDIAAPTIAPRITLISNGTARPLVGCTSVIVPPKFDSVTYDSEWTSTGVLFGQGDSIEYIRRSSRRGSEFSLTLHDAEGTLTPAANGVCTLAAAYQTTGEAPTLMDLVTGYLVGTERDRTSQVDMQLPLRIVDFFGSRMPRKRMIYMPSFARMAVGDALTIIGNRLGFPTTQIDAGAFAPTVLPGPQVLGELAMFWGAEASPEEALDEIARCAGAIIGIDGSGKLTMTSQPVYGSADYTLDSDTTTPGEIVRHIRYSQELDRFVNNMFVFTGSEGWRQTGWARDAASEATSSADDFIGDQFIECESFERTYYSAATLATNLLAYRGRFAEVIEWQPLQAHVDLAPGKFVKAQIEQMQITADSIWYITEERGTIIPTLKDAGGWQQRFTMVRWQ